MPIYFAGDHAGFEMKGQLMEFVRSLGFEAEDLGPFSYVAGDDYPDYVIPLARKVASQAQTYADHTQNYAEKKSPRESASSMRQSAARGIVVAGSGQGEIIAMNRVKGARAALFCPCLEARINADGSADKRGCRGLELIKASREHNDSNILALGARFCTVDEAKKGITVWLETPFSNEERHIRRLRKVEQMTDNP